MNQRPFDLELAIDTWRSFFKRRKAFFADDLEELELHLREATAHLVESGLSEEEAFRQAKAHIGDVVMLDEVFKSVFWRKIKHQDKLLSTLTFQLSMFRNYVKIAVRNLIKHKGYSSLNIAGLAVGLACSFFVFLWVQNEFSTDQFHQNASRIQQVKINVLGGGRVTTWSNAPQPLAELLELDYPEVRSAVLKMPIKAALRHEEQASRETGYFAGEGFFEAFTFPFIVGDPSKALDSPASIAISEEMAVKYFGSEWLSGPSVVGQPFTLDYWQSNGGVLGEAVAINEPLELVVSGVFENVPSASTLVFDFILSAEVVLTRFGHLTDWGPRWFELILLLEEGVDLEAFGTKIGPLLKQNANNAENHSIFLQPFADTYLHGSFVQGVQSGGRIERIYIIGLVGLAILLIACINFTNLVTARSNQRAREIGVRKAMGATPSFLIQQFLGEAILTALVAFVFAVALMSIALPLYGAVSGTIITLSQVTLSTWAAFLAIALFTGFVAGGYPAFYLASLNTVRVFKNQAKAAGKGEVSTRKGLVVIQFAISVFLIVGTLTVYQQLAYLQSKDLGLNRDDVVVMRLDGDMLGQFEAVRTQLLESAAIVNVTQASDHPLSVAIENGNVRWEGQREGEVIAFKVLRTDEHFAQTMQLRISQGRFFEPGRDEGRLNFVVNESAVQAMALDKPLEHPFVFGYDVEGEGTGSGQIIGVVEDFHSGSLADQHIGPLIMRYEPEATNVLLAKVVAPMTNEGISVLSQVSREYNPGYPFEFTFLDDAYGEMYRDQRIVETLSRIFAFMAILIAGLGLLGLSAFSVQQRTKEIGMRRVLGATRANLLLLLSREFILLVSLSLVVALPAAYFVMSSWLSGFAYRIDMGFGVPIVAALISLAIAVVTVGYQSLRAIRQDPVVSLKCE